MKTLVENLVIGDVIPVPRHEMSWLGKDAKMTVTRLSEGVPDKRGPWVKVHVNYTYQGNERSSAFAMRPKTTVESSR